MSKIEENKNIEKAKPKVESDAQLEKMEIMISRFLRFGVLLSAAFILCGILLFIITGHSGYKGTYFPTTFAEVFVGLLKLRPFAIILTGLIVLIFTPIFRVGVTILIFWKNKDYTFLKITVFVFAVLVFSFFMGKVE